MKKIKTSEIKEIIRELRAGDDVLLSGTVYTARDAAHARLCKMIDAGEPLPFSLDGAVIYYAGPTPARDGAVIGSCGPTTSSRMDKFAPILIENGLLGMIGKGKRSESVIESMKSHGAVYFCAVGGAGALYAKCIRRADVIAFDELGCEAVRKLEVEDFPLIVGIDAFGNCAIK